jgi:FixJ family two-component response regulator
LPNQHYAKTIYLIDDDDSFRDSLSQMLRFMGFQVKAFNSAKAFLIEPIQDIPAVVLTDMRMPDMSGVEMQEVLASRVRKIPIIFISGESSMSHAIKAMKHGAIEFLQKPISREDLIAAIAHGMQMDVEAMHAVIKKSALDERLKVLSPRERKTFELLSKGYSNAELVQELGVALFTAKQYKKEVMSKLHLRSLSELIQLKNL